VAKILFSMAMDKKVARDGESGRDLAAMKRKVREESKKGYVQHVNEVYPGVYKIEDWYDSDQTVASFTHGREL